MVNNPLLDMQFDYWRRFIRDDGSLDKAKMLANGYDGEGQVDWLENEMNERGWLGISQEPTDGVSSDEPPPVVFAPKRSKKQKSTDK